MLRAVAFGISRAPVSLIFAGLLIGSCGGKTDDGLTRAGGASSTEFLPLPDGGALGVRDVPDTIPSAPLPSGSMSEDDEPAFEERGCPEVSERVRNVQCDPFAEEDGCGPGLSCQPFVQYPDSTCEPEVFGTRCELAGVGEQGEPCRLGNCAPRHTCVATGQGTQCAKLCQLTSESGCPPGLVCGSIDIEGFGICF